MKGIEVKNILKRNGFVIKEIAKLMSETPQNINSMLNADDIKTGVLERIANATKKSVYFFYEEQEPIRDQSQISEQFLDNEERSKLLNMLESQQKMLASFTEKLDSQQRTIESQQKLISSQQLSIAELIEKKQSVLMEDDARCADVG